MPLRKSDLSITQLSALADASETSLRLYRRGYAVTKGGPFHADRTVKSLDRRGLIAITGKTLRARATTAGRKLMNDDAGAEDRTRNHIG